MRNNIQSLVLIRSDNSGCFVCFFCLLIHIIREVLFILDLVCKPLNKIIVWIACFICVRIYEIYNVTVFFICVKDGLAVPFIHCRIALGLFRIPVIPLRSYPVRSAPAQNADLDVPSILLGNFFCICRHDKSRGTRSVGFFIFRTHCAGFRSGGVVSVISHLHLDMGKQWMLSSKEIFQHLPVFVRILCLVVQKKVACAVSV